MTKQDERLIAYRRTITIIAVVVTLYLSFLIIKPFLVAIIGAAILSYLFYPLYKWLAKALPKFLPGESLSAIIIVLLIILIVLIPMAALTGLMASEARSWYIFIQHLVSQPGFVFDLPPVLKDKIGDVAYLEQFILNVSAQLVGWLQGVVVSLPGAFLSVFITVFSIYFFLKGGSGLNEFAQEFFPLPEGRYRQVLKKFDELSRGMVMGQIIVGVIHGFLSWFAYSYLGLPNPVLWAFVTAIVSIIPVLGAGLIWFPIAVFLFVSGLQTGLYWKGIALFTYGLLLMSSIDNILKPKIIGDRARIHPLVILFGILGGIQFIGLPGIVIGPLILALFDVVMSIFREVV